MKTFVPCTLVLLTLLFDLNLQPSSSFAQGTAFTYQGRLDDGANPANGIYDLRFIIYDSTNNPGTVIAGPLTNSATGVSNGLFTVTLDFGASVFTGPDRWLEIGVRTNGGGTFAMLDPRQNLTPTPYAITANYLADVVANNILGVGNFSTIGGGYGNASPGYDSTVGGGGANTSGGLYATVAGGGFNTTAGTGSTIGGGYENTNNGYMATIAGGQQNFISGDFASIAGGTNNSIQTGSYLSTIGGGGNNTIQTNAFYATIGGGRQNMIQPKASHATIGGGFGNTIQTNATYATIGGGFFNTIQPDATYATIGGGFFNMIQPDASWSTIGGGYNNTIQTNTYYATIGGGEVNMIQTNANDATVGGGYNNTIQPDAVFSTIGGGGVNTIQSNAFNSTIAGGGSNVIGTNAYHSTISGGGNNTIQAGAFDSTIGGGDFNTVLTNASYSTIGGGYSNFVSGLTATVAGGYSNSASGSTATVGGGQYNIAGGSGAAVAGGQVNTASGYAGTIGGGVANQASGLYSTVPGGTYNVAAGSTSFAAGFEAQALHSGSFVWADSQFAPFASTANDQFLIRAQGGVGIGTGSPRAQFNVNGTARIDASSTAYNEGLALNLPTDMSGGGYGGIHFHNAARGGAFGSNTIKWGMFYNYAPGLGGIGGGGLAIVQNNTTTRLNFATNGSTTFYSNPGQTAGVTLAAGGGAWTTMSDRNAKENFQPVNSTEVLEKVAALPLTTWNYKAQDARIHHLGPMAQDFMAAFGLGESHTGITTVDEEGVALAAIQGLNQKLEQKETEITELKQKNESLEKRLEAVEEIVRNQKSN